MRALSKLTPAAGFTAVLFLAAGWLASEIPTSDSAVLGGLPPDYGGGLVVQVSGLRGAEGSVVIAIYADPDAYHRYDFEALAAYQVLPATDGILRATFPDLTSGPYAVTVFHDEDGDLVFDRTEGGYPAEGYGTSGARDAYDEPPFERAAVWPGLVPIDLFYL